MYIGSTDDLKERLEAHNRGKVQSTRDRIPLVLVYYEAYKDEYEARHREQNLKLRANALNQLKRRISRSVKQIY